MDVVGLDTAVNVSNNLLKDLDNDESKETFKLPALVKNLYDKKLWGIKQRKVFIKKRLIKMVKRGLWK